MSIQENNLIRGVALNDGQVGQIDYNFLANQPTIKGQPVAGELSEVLALKGETSEIHTGSDEPPASAKVWIDPNGDEAVSLPETVEQVVKEYMEENPETDPTVPEWAKRPDKPTYTAAEVGALPADTVIPDGGIPIPPTASVGQTIVVKAVDEDGKPTEWESADLPSGGGAKWETIADITTTEEVDIIAITTDTDGNAFELSDAAISVAIVGTGSNTAESALGISVNAQGNAGGRNTSASRMFRSTGTFKCAYRLGAHASVIFGQVYNVDNSANGVAGFYKHWDSTNMRAFYFDGGIFGIGSRVVIEGVRK